MMMKTVSLLFSYIYMYVAKTWNNWNTLIISGVTAKKLEQKLEQNWNKNGTKLKKELN